MSAANMDDAGGHLISAHIAGCMEVSGLVTCTLAGWDLELCTSAAIRAQQKMSLLGAALLVPFLAPLWRHRPARILPREDCFVQPGPSSGA